MPYPVPSGRGQMGADIETAGEPCVVCGSHAVRRLFAARDRLYNLPGEFWVVRCASCEQLRTSPRPSEEALALYYPENYGPHAEPIDSVPTAAAEEGGGAWRWIRRHVATRRIWWMPDLPPGARVLELGSGAGHFVRYALARGWEVHALEPAAKPAERLMRDPRVHVHQGLAEKVSIPVESLDAAFAWMVVEHLENPVAVFRRLAAALKPEGYFVFSVPNAGSWEFGFFRECWYGLDVPRHLWHFTPRTLRRLLGTCGFRIEQVYHQKVLRNLTGSLDLWCAGLALRPASLTRWLDRILSNPWVSFGLGAALAAIRQGGRLTVVARATLRHPLA